MSVKDRFQECEECDEPFSFPSHDELTSHAMKQCKYSVYLYIPIVALNCTSMCIVEKYTNQFTHANPISDIFRTPSQNR